MHASRRTTPKRAHGDELWRYLIVPPPRQQAQPASTAAPPADRSTADCEYNEEAPCQTVNSIQADALGMEIAKGPQQASNSTIHSSMDQDSSKPAPVVYTIEQYLAGGNAAGHGRDDVVGPVPCAIGARSSKYTIALHERAQALHLSQPAFVYSGDSLGGWRCSAVLEGVVRGVDLNGRDDGLGDTDLSVPEDGVFSSKQEAKERASERALALLEELLEIGRVVPLGKAAKRKSGQGSQEAGAKEREVGINYIGQLLEFQRSTSSAQPTYTDFQHGTRFSCIATIDGLPGKYGSHEALFPSKKAARQHAAGLLVQHFKDAGVWPETVGDVSPGIKKKKTAIAAGAASSLPRPEAAAAQHGGAPEGTSSVDVDLGDHGEVEAPAVASTSHAARVAALCAQLALVPPEYTIVPSITSSDPALPFYTAHCTFRSPFSLPNQPIPSAHHAPSPSSAARSEPFGTTAQVPSLSLLHPPFDTPVCTVRHVFGKKKAKEVCAGLVLDLLEGIRRRRIAAAGMQGTAEVGHAVEEKAKVLRTGGWQGTARIGGS